jgi:hypothetical protein
MNVGSLESVLGVLFHLIERTNATRKLGGLDLLPVPCFEYRHNESSSTVAILQS